MSIFPLPQFEADLKELHEEDRKAYEALKAPTSVVVRYGAMKLVGEFPYEGTAKPGCGSKLVVRTHRGTELGEMLTSTCPNSGCSKSVSRQEMLQYIENSGGRDYPFTTAGKVLRIATAEDLEAQARLEQSRHALKMDARRRFEARRIPAKVVDAEPILGGERLTFYYFAEERMDLHAVAEELQQAHGVRVEMKLVGARDEARLTADYEKCGQYCCCKNFLKVLKPVNMKSAKTQKATLDPLKISGRCGRLMCCLRYEDQTYEELAKRLPRKKSRVGTPEGDGIVIETQILTQLALVLLDNSDKRVAVPVENLTPPENAVAPPPPPPPAFRERGDRGARPERPDRPGRPDRRERPTGDRPRRDDRPRPVPQQAGPGASADAFDLDDIETDHGDEGMTGTRRPTGPGDAPHAPHSPHDGPGDGGSQPGKRKRRRRKRRAGAGPGEPGPEGRTPLPHGGAAPGAMPPREAPPREPGSHGAPHGSTHGGSPGGPTGQPGDPQRKKRRKRRRKGPRPDGAGPSSGGGPGGGTSGGGPEA